MKVIQFSEKEFNLLFEKAVKDLELETRATTNWIPDNISDEKLINTANVQVNNVIREMHRRFHYHLIILKNSLTE